MKKRFLCKMMILLILVSLIFTFSGCGNMSLGLGNFTFKKVHIHITGELETCLTIEKWHDDEMGIEVLTKEYGSLFLSEGTYILVEDKCPICDK